MSYFGEGFKPEDLEVKEGLYEEKREGLPNIIWHTKIDQHTKFGYWSCERSHFSDGRPQYVDWKDHEIQYGTNPNSPLTPVYITYRLRCVVLGVRKRWIVDGSDGRRYFYPWFTRKEDRVGGKPTGHIQVMVALPDYPEKQFVLGLRGYAKNMSWSNDPDGFGSGDFPLGVEQVLMQEAEALTNAARESGYSGPPIHWMCSLWVDLVPALTEQDGKKKAHAVNLHGTYCNPFSADMRLKEAQGEGDIEAIKTRFVGTENFKYFQSLRRDVALEWEAEWKDATSEAAGAGYQSQDEPVIKEDDEIPF